MNNLFSTADIMLPNFIDDKDFAHKWAVVACDQYTSEPEYWKNAYTIVDSNESTLNMILPEAFLDEKSEEKLSDISACMRKYIDSVLEKLDNAFVFVRRGVSNGKIRNGIVGKVDLEEYDYNIGSNTPIRATEGTVLERIPPRVEIRRGAEVELPHIMLLIDDPQKNVIEPLAEELDKFHKLYDFDLMLDGGHVEGYLLNEESKASFSDRLKLLFASSSNSIKLAVGDGNHSLASAKARYEEIKKEIGEEAARKHPSRYALCEIVNLHDDSLVFEPIYRLVKTNDTEVLINELKAYGASCNKGSQTVKCIIGDSESEINLGNGTHTLVVGTLQKFLDDYKTNHKDVEIDYIHGIDSIKKLSEEDGYIGFIFEGMDKSELFEAVEKDGALPRKTFSMGEAQDKRYYIECRKITE